MYICDSTTVCLLLGEWHQEERELEGQVEQTVQARKRSAESAAHSGVTATKELHHRPGEMVVEIPSVPVLEGNPYLEGNVPIWRGCP